MPAIPAIVAHSFPVWLPQTQTWLYHQVRFLPDTVIAHIICKETQNLDQFDLPRIHTLIGSSSPAGKLSTRLLRHIDYHLYVRHKCRLIRPDILHSHFGPVGWKNIRMLKTGRNPELRKIRHIVTFYGQDVDHLPKVQPVWRERYQEMFRHVDMVLCEGSFMADKVEALGCPPDRIQVQHLGVDLETISFEPRFKSPDEPFRILMAAAFRPKKGFLYGLKALDQLAERFDLRITIVGDSTGEPDSEREKERIFDIISNSHLAGKVTLTGFLSQRKLQDVARQHHIYLAPSITADDGDSEGGAPVSLIEMATSGMPVVSSNHCDIPEVIVHGETGFLAPEKDVGRLTALLANLLSQPDSWAGIAERSRKRIEQKYDAVRQGLFLSNLYNMTANKRLNDKYLNNSIRTTGQSVRTSRPRILFISHSSAMYGAERSLLTLLDGLQETGIYDIRVLLPSDGPLRDALEAIGITCMITTYERWVGLRFRIFARYWRKMQNRWHFSDMLKLVTTWDPDLVYSNTIASGAGARLIGKLPRRPRHILHARELPERSDFGYFDYGSRRTYRYLIRNTDRFIFNSRFLKDSIYPYLKKAGDGIKDEDDIKSAVNAVYNGFRQQTGDPAKQTPARDDPGTGSQKQLKLIMAGGITAVKNHSEAVKAMQILIERGISTRLDIYGDGRESELKRLRQEVQDAGLSGHIFLNGYHNDIGSLFCDADLLMVTSRMEAFGRVAVEAMLAGCPVIGADSGGLPEIIRNGETGLLYKPGDVRDLASKIELLWSDPEQRSRLSKAGRAFVQSAFTLDQYISQIHHIIQEELPLNKRTELSDNKIDV